MEEKSPKSPRKVRTPMSPKGVGYKKAPPLAEPFSYVAEQNGFKPTMDFRGYS